MEELAYMMWK